MKVKMKRFEAQCYDSVKEFMKSWEYACIAKDCYIRGYKEAKRDVLRELLEYYPKTDLIKDILHDIENVGESLVEREVNHQLTNLNKTIDSD